MKKSDAHKAIEKVLEHYVQGSDESPAKDILEALQALGMLPPKRDYIEHYAWKHDHTWEKES